MTGGGLQGLRAQELSHSRGSCRVLACGEREVQLPGRRERQRARRWYGPTAGAAAAAAAAAEGAAEIIEPSSSLVLLSLCRARLRARLTRCSKKWWRNRPPYKHTSHRHGCIACCPCTSGHRGRQRRSKVALLCHPCIFPSRETGRQPGSGSSSGRSQWGSSWRG